MKIAHPPEMMSWLRPWFALRCLKTQKNSGNNKHFQEMMPTSALSSFILCVHGLSSKLTAFFDAS